MRVAVTPFQMLVKVPHSILTAATLACVLISLARINADTPYKPGHDHFPANPLYFAIHTYSLLLRSDTSAVKNTSLNLQNVSHNQAAPYVTECAKC